jgi:hypothetical protein
MEQHGEIILYQPNEEIRVEVRLENETVWLTQQQIAELFGVKQPAISKHLKNIFSSGELQESSVHSILEYTAADGKIYKTAKDLGKRLFAFSKLDINAKLIIPKE